jgi:predicted nucleotidyltransferase
VTIPKKARQILGRVVDEQPYPLLFATVSGAHHYGFPSPDSDFDLRGVHILPTRQVVGLEELEETIEVSADRDGLELDLVTHDVRKFFTLLLRKNGYVLEQLHSPLVVHAAPELEELRDIAKDCVTKHHAHHYLGFAQTQRNLFLKEDPPRVKPLLYVYRVLLTGVHLMRTGEIQANLVALNEEFKLSWLDELLDAKIRGEEKVRAKDIDAAFHEKEYMRLRALLEESSAASSLPDLPSAKPRLNDLLVRLRLGSRR